MCRRLVFFLTSFARDTIMLVPLSFIFLTSGCTSIFISSKESNSTDVTVTSSKATSTYGTAVTFTATGDETLTGQVTFYDGVNVIGTETYRYGSSTFTTTSLGVGSHSITATFLGNYLIGPVTSPAIKQVVEQAVPTISWTAPAPITFGTALSATQLDANSNGVDGTFTYSPAAGSTLSAGSQTLTVTFNPADITDYAVATQTVDLTVNKATPVIIWPAPESLGFGIPLSGVELDASSAVPGTFTYSPPAGTVLNAGPHELTATLTPSNSANYNDAIATTTQMIIQPTITLTAQAPAVLRGSTDLFVARVTGAVNSNVNWEVNGIIGGNATAGTITNSGVYTAPESSDTTATVTAVLQANPAIQGSEKIQVVGPENSPGAIAFGYTLPTAAATSAGVYDSSGALIRTLWSNENISAGPQTAIWDGKDDSGNPAPAGSYQIRVLYNNVTYTWGLIGDTSASWTATNSWDAQDLLPDDIAFLGSTAYTANGYAEGHPNASTFDTSHPERPEALFTSGYCSQIEFVTTDGKLVYFANVGNGYPNSAGYIFAYNPETQKYFDFSAGSAPYSCNSNSPRSVIDYAPNLNNPGSERINVPTGIAVQSHGDLLAVSHGADVSMKDATNSPGEDLIKLFNKTSGVQVGEIPLHDPQGIAFAPDNSLWAISGNSVVQITLVGSENLITTLLPGLSKPLALSVDSTTSDVLVADGGSSQQVKRYSAAGQLLAVYGDLGGYADCNPVVTKTRLFLDATAGPDYSGYSVRTFVAADPDGSFWIGDPGNARVLHISAQEKYLGQIAFLRFLYHVAADHGNPRRVFAGNLEFSVDYSKPLLPGDPDPSLGGNGSWSLVRNWAACLANNYAPQFTQVQTFGNGRTYALAPNLKVKSIWNGAPVNELVELPASGSLKFSGRYLDNASGYPEFFDGKGNLAYWVDNKTGGKWTQQIAYQQRLIGYDNNAWPQWGSPSTLASVPLVSSTDPAGFRGWGMYSFPEATAGGIFATYNTSPSIPGTDHHLGGVIEGHSRWTWEASPGAAIKYPDGKGTFPDIESYGGHNGIAAFVEGKNIFEGYDGQSGTFSSQWIQWNEDGLLIGQFGHPAKGLASDSTLFPGAATNIWTMVTVSAGDSIYLYNSDEGYHTGIHQWKVGGLDSIHELSGSARLGDTVILH